jgi:hypothetical protein
MPRRCTLCDHPERHTGDEGLVGGTPYLSASKRFGLSDSAVYRHKSERRSQWRRQHARLAAVHASLAAERRAKAESLSWAGGCGS